jgi:16S rRNA (cytosine967-C5)-methyltransferase
VLRRIAREGEGIVAAQDAPVLNTPDWLWPRWTQNFGEGTARAIAKAHLAIPPLDLSYAGATAPEIPDAVQLAAGCLRLSSAGRVEDIPGYLEGRWWVQDFAASLPVRLLGDVMGREVIDLCAAPGGKTAQLCAAGARVTAVDLSSERLERVRENLTRLKFEAELVAADARDWRPREPAPFVLLDAPCTATGTIRRHPDLPWLKSAADIEICANLQQELLDAAAEMTAPDGVLVYAVCSLEPDECEEQLQTFMRRHSDFIRKPLQAGEACDPLFVTAEGDIRTLPSYWPEKGGMDGFFVARIHRRS